MTQREENLDVARTSQHPETGCKKGIAGGLAEPPLLSSLGAYTAQPDHQQKHRRRYRPGGTQYITVAQATNIIDAVEYAKFIGLPLVAHLTIHWAYTDLGDDPDGKLFARLREGLNKWLQRHGTMFAGAWCVSACRVVKPRWCTVICCSTCRSSSAPKGSFKSRRRSIASFSGTARLLGRTSDRPSDPRNPDGKYLIKGGGPKVWKQFHLRKEHRRLQGVIHGKRCGTTHNIGPAARRQAAARGRRHNAKGQTSPSAEAQAGLPLLSGLSWEVDC